MPEFDEIWSALHIEYQKSEDMPVDTVDCKLGHYLAGCSLDFSARGGTIAAVFWSYFRFAGHTPAITVYAR